MVSGEGESRLPVTSRVRALSGVPFREERALSRLPAGQGDEVSQERWSLTIQLGQLTSARGIASVEQRAVLMLVGDDLASGLPWHTTQT